MKSMIVFKVGGYRQEAYGEISINNIGMRRMVLTRVFKPVSWTNEDRTFTSLKKGSKRRTSVSLITSLMSKEYK